MMMSSLLTRRTAHAAVRSIHTRRKMKVTYGLPQSLIDNLPKQKVAVQASTEPEDEHFYHRNPVTSAHAIDVAKGEVSAQDSVALSPSGTVVHGRYGDLGEAAEGIPLEYTALLHPSAEGAAAVRAIGGSPGTVLVFGASQANGMAASQLAAAAGHAVVGVVGADHACHDDMLEYMKALIPEPGTAVAEEYAMAKKNFSDLVDGISTGQEGLACYSADEMLEEFKANLVEYAAKYPEDLPAAVDPSEMKFLGMEKDKDQFRANMEAYLAQYPPGAPPVDKQKLEAYFSIDQYEIFRNKFWEQTTNVISGDESHFFSPPHIVEELMKTPGKVDKKVYPGAGPKISYSFSHVDPTYPKGTEPKAGGPIVGAVISVTPDLAIAANAVDAAKTLRGKAEALQFLTQTQRAAFISANSVASQAKKAGAPVVAMGGSLPGIETVKPTDADVKEALSAMAIQDDGSTKLNYFIQVYRAGDFPFYADYAAHRATEPLAGPRQIVVTK